MPKPRSAAEERALAYVNRLREKGLGLKPLAGFPKSRPGCVQRCVLANALTNKTKFAEVYGSSPGDINVWAAKDCNISRSGWWFPKPDAEPILAVSEVPKYIGKFTEAFDEGAYPHLVKS